MEVGQGGRGARRVPIANNRPDCAREYRLALVRGSIDYVSPPRVNYWFAERGAIRAQFPLSGTPISLTTGDPIIAFVNLQLDPMNPLLGAALIWDDMPIYRLDVGGWKHKNVANIFIPTPHRHFYREPDGLWECEPVDLRAEGIRSKSDHGAIAQYFFEWCGLDSRAMVWQNPPLMQAPLKPNVMPRFGSAGRKRK